MTKRLRAAKAASSRKTPTSSSDAASGTATATNASGATRGRHAARTSATSTTPVARAIAAAVAGIAHAGRPRGRVSAPTRPTTSRTTARTLTRRRDATALGRASGPRRARPSHPCDLAFLEGLDDVALLEVLVVLEADAALEALAHLADVFLESPQRRDLALPDDRALAQEPHLGPARDDAVRDVATRNPPDARHREHLADLCVAGDDFFELGLEHADERVVHVGEQVVDDLVEAHLHALALGNLARLAIGPDVEADDRRVRHRGQRQVGLRDPADAAVVDHRAHATPCGAGDDDVADPEGAFLHEGGDDRAAALVEVRLQHVGTGELLRVRVQVLRDLTRVGHEQQRVEEVVDPLTCRRGHVDDDRVAAPLFGHELLFGQLLADPRRVRVLAVDLRHRNDDRHGGLVLRAGVADRLDRLRHHA